MRRLIALLGALVVAAAVAVATMWPHHRNHTTPAADVLGRPQQTTSLHLLSFLATDPDTRAGSSRSEAVQIVSLLNQYGAKGLSAEIVDESTTDAHALINTYYDWQLGDVRLSADQGGALARRYGVTTTPTTLLIDRTGTVVARWNSYTPTAQPAQVIGKNLT